MSSKNEPEANRGDRSQWQTGVEAHNASCSRVNPMPLACYVYIETGCCTECGARVSIARSVDKPLLYKASNE